MRVSGRTVGLLLALCAMTSPAAGSAPSAGSTVTKGLQTPVQDADVPRTGSIATHLFVLSSTDTISEIRVDAVLVVSESAATANVAVIDRASAGVERSTVWGLASDQTKALAYHARNESNRLPPLAHYANRQPRPSAPLAGVT